jgi:hypothetical protein
MKKAFKLIGIAVMLAAIAFSMAACDDGSGPGGSGGGGSGSGGGSGGGGGSSGGSGGTASLIGTWDAINPWTDEPLTGYYASRFEFTANSFDLYSSSMNPEHCAYGTLTKDGSVIIATITTAYNVSYKPGYQYRITFEDNNNLYINPLGGPWRRRR